VVDAVEAVLQDHLGERLKEARQTDEVFAEEVAGRVRDIALRGGKRLRAGWSTSVNAVWPRRPVSPPRSRRSAV
jgi:hypothetical protein